MTGQVDFDSHTSGVVLATVAAVNVVTPGMAHGRPYQPPSGHELADELAEALSPGARRDMVPSVDQAAELAAYLDDLRAVIARVDAADLDDACRRVNDLLGVTGATPVLSRHDGQAWHLHFHAPEAPWAVGWAGSMATALAMVLGSTAHDRLGVCSATACDRVYVDVSRNGTRRFCSVACQNRVKAAAFRERQKL